MPAQHRMRIGTWRLAVPCLLAMSSVLAGPAGRAEDLNVAVAANFFGTLQKLAPKFEQASGNKLLLSSGSSGQFYTQIRQGAPFDVLLSADSDRPRQLEQRAMNALEPQALSRACFAWRRQCELRIAIRISRKPSATA